MDQEFLAGEDRSLARRSVGPVVLLLPLAFALLAVAFLRDASLPTLGPRAEPPIQGTDGDVAGWAGELTLDGGRKLRVTLGPLHSDDSRQAFDSRALAERFGLRQGQVFKLVLSELSKEDAAAQFELPIAPNELSVTDGNGLAMSVLTPKISAPTDGVADPLRVLLSAPDRMLNEGGRATWILWGRSPGTEARVEGFDSGVSLPLTERRLPREQVDVALLRRDR